MACGVSYVDEIGFPFNWGSPYRIQTTRTAYDSTADWTTHGPQQATSIEWVKNTRSPSDPGTIR